MHRGEHPREQPPLRLLLAELHGVGDHNPAEHKVEEAVECPRGDAPQLAAEVGAGTPPPPQRGLGTPGWCDGGGAAGRGSVEGYEGYLSLGWLAYYYDDILYECCR